MRNAFGLLIAMLASCGCVSLPTHAPLRSTVLLSVLLKDVPSSAQPTGLVIGIDGQPGAAGQQFAFAADTRIPDQYTAFLVRLDLPAGSHRLTHLSGVLGTGQTVPAFDVATDMSFEVKAGTTRYLGHVEVAPPRVVLADAYESDLPRFAQAWPTLRPPAIERHAPADIVSIPAEMRVPVVQPPKAVAARLDASAAVGLPNGVRAAFLKFLQSGYPRAFAVASNGHAGTASGGEDVIGRALRTCQRMQTEPRKVRCQLFALDDTLISSLQASSRAPDEH